MHLLEIQEDFLDGFLVFFRREGSKPLFKKKNKKTARKAPELQEMNSKFRLLYQYFSGNLNEIPATVSMADSMRMICKKAKEEGLEVIGAEIRSRSLSFSTKGSEESARLQNFNANAASLIRAINEPFVVFVGAAHGKLRRDGIPGLSDYLDCPCIGLVASNLNPFVQPGTHQFEAPHYSVDSVLF